MLGIFVASPFTIMRGVVEWFIGSKFVDFGWWFFCSLVTLTALACRCNVLSLVTFLP